MLTTLAFIVFPNENSHSEIEIDLHILSDLSDDIKKAGVIGFSIKDSIVQLDLNTSNLCSLWEIHSFDNGNTTSFCQGSAKCCDFIDYEPYYDAWDEDIFLYEGKYGTTKNSSISARIIYVDYSLDSADLYSDIHYTDKAYLDFILPEPQTSISELLAYLEENYSEYYSNLLKFNTSFVFGNEISIALALEVLDAARFAALNISSSNVTFNATIKDSQGNDVEAIVEFYDMTGNLEEAIDFEVEEILTNNAGAFQTATDKIKKVKKAKPVNLNKGKHKVVIKPSNHIIQDITINDFIADSDVTEFIKFEELDISEHKELDNYVQVYAIDPTAMDFTTADVTVVATGTALYKCKEWNFAEQKCYGEWQKLMDITPGIPYIFTLTPDDPALAEGSGTFYDGFESGLLSTNNWTTSGSGNTWLIDSSSYAGSYCIECEGESLLEPITLSIKEAVSAEKIVEKIIETNISTNGYENINFTFYAQTVDLDPGEYFAADWYNGTNWTNVLTIEDIAVYTFYNYTLTSDANNNSLFKIRFRCSSSETKEFCRLDDVRVDGVEQQISSSNITFNSTIEDSSGNDIASIIEFYDADGKLEGNTSLDSKELASDPLIVDAGTYTVIIKPTNHVIKNITIMDYVADSDITDFIKFEELNISADENLSNYVQAYAIDPTAMNFTTANVTIVAEGTALYKCKDWNFTSQECFGEWELFKTGLLPGQEYTFELTPDDPGFGEVIENIYYLFNASDSQYSAYQQMKNETVGATGYISATVSLNSLGVICFTEKWIAPNWTTQTRVNGTWNFSIFGDCSASNPDAYLFAKILKYNGTEYNPFNTTFATSNICAAAAFNNWGDNVPYSDDINLSPGERIGVQFCLNVTSAANKVAQIQWENTEASYVKFPSASLIVDTDPPQITLLGPSDNYTTGPTDIDFTFKAVDETPPLNCSIYIDDVLNQTNESTASDTTTSFTVSGLSVGNHSWFINCTDSQDYSNISESRNFTITAGLPTAQITYPASGSNISDPTPRITFVLTDDTTADINYTIFINDSANGQNGTVANGSSTNLSLSPALEVGDYIIIVQATDDDGNSVNSTPITITIVPPLVYLVSPESNYADKDGDINFTFYVYDPAHDNLNCSLYINDILNQTNSSTNESINTTFEVSGIDEGAGQTWKVECIDPTETAASNQRTFTVDKTKPSVTLNSPDNDYATNETAVYFNWTATDNIDTILYCNLTIDGVVNMSDYFSPNGSEVSHDVQGFADGSHSWNVTCWDDATNANTSETRNFTVDTTPPTINISVNDTDVEYGLESVLIDFNASNIDLDSVIANVTYPNGTLLQQLTDQSVDFEFVPANLTALGRYNITVFANDTSGNTNTSTDFFYVNDTTQPSVFDLIPTADLHFNISDIIEIAANVTDLFAVANVSANITSPNGTSTLLELSNAAGEKYNSSFTAPSLIGRYNVTFTANDTSNNINDTETTYFYVRGNTSLWGYGSALSDFSFASSDYVIGVHRFFNTSRPNTNLTLFLSMNIKKLTGEGANDVWIRFKVDNVEILEEKLRTVETIGDEGCAGIKPVTFNVSSGEHNYTIEFKRSGDGSVDVNDADLVLLKFITTLENTVRVQLTTDSYNHSSTSFVPAFNWTITKSYSSPTYFITKQTIQGNASSATADYYFEDLDANNISPFWRRYLSSPSDIGSVSGINIEDANPGICNHTIQSKTSAGTVIVDFSLIEFDLNDNELNLINSFQVSNPLTNLTASKNYSEGLHNLANKTVTIQNGTQYVLAMTSSFGTTTGSQTPVYFINSSEVPESSCYSKKERYLSSDSDVGNAFIYTVCENLTVGNTYTFNLWLNVSSGENVSQFDESFNGFEITEFDTTSINLAPIPNEITNPAHGDHERAIINITWLAFSDPNDDQVTYNISLFNSDDTFNQTINTSTGLTYQSFNSTTVSDGDWMIYVEGCDDGNLCSNSSTNFTIDNIAPTINISVNDTDVEYGLESVLIDFNASNVDLDSVIANVTYPNGTLLQQLTDQSVDFIFVPANLTEIGRYNITVFANDTSSNTNTTTSYFNVNDTTPPTWDQTPQNQVTEYNASFSYDINASDNYLVDKYYVNDSTNFAIDSDTGVITNATTLTPGILFLNISVNDTYNNINSTVISITVQDNIDPVLSITYPVNGSTYDIIDLTLNWTFTEDYLDKCWYNLNNNATNTSIANCSSFYINFTAIDSAWNNITMWMNDTSNNMDEENVTFYIQTNTAPNVTNVTITPKYNSIYVSTLNDMHCNYTYNDAEGDNDTSTIAWYKNNVLTSFTNATVQYQNTSIGEQWICEVTPYDGINYSAPINSSYAEIGTERTNITVSDNATIYTGPAPNNQYTIWAYYTDEDGNAILGASCSISGNPDTALSDGNNDGNYTFTTQWSTTGDRIHTFSCSKVNYQTQNNIERTVTVINHPTDLVGYQNATDIEVNQYVNFTVNYTDANTSSLLTGTDCDLNISGIGIYNMTETASNTYEVIVQFPTPGEFTPEVTCSKEYYQDANLTMDIVNATDNINPSVNISINDTDVIHGVENVKIDFNASDLFLDSVIANVTYPNGTLLQQLINQSVDFTLEPDNLTAIGQYNITVFANDTSNNINLSESFFYVNDTSDPTTSISVNDTDVEYGTESVTIDFNASDSFLDSVIANVTYPNGTLLQQLTNQATDFVFEPANLTVLGRYNITVFANDTTGNTNTTTSFFYVNDTIAPTINISVNDTDVEYGVESVLIDFNASNDLLDSVIANVTYPNGTLFQQLTDQSVDFTFIPANLTALGRYNITVFANDTSGNTNTSISYFYVNDTIYPAINISINDTDVIYGVESVRIDFNASDYLLDSVIANVTYPNGTLLQQLTDQSVDFIFGSDNLTAVGQYDITVFANDTSNHINLSESFFYVNDTIYPTINISVNDTYVEYGVESVNIDFNASDSFLDSVIANVTYPNGTLLQQLTDQSVDFTFVPANLTELGWYNITVIANDTSGNTNTSTSSFEVFEHKWYDNRTDPSGIVYYFPDADYQFNVSWNLTIDTVYFEHNFTGTLQNYTAAGNLSQEFYYNYTNIQPGSYIWKSLANDTSGTWYSTDSHGGNYWDYEVLPFDNYTLNGTVVDVDGSFLNASYKIYNSTGDLVYSSNESFDFDFSGTEKYDLQVTPIYDENINHYWINGLFNNSDMTDAIIAGHNTTMTLTVIDPSLLNYDSLVIEKQPVSSANDIFFKCDSDYNLSTYACSGTWRPWYNIKSAGYENYTFASGDPALIEGNGTFFEDFETGTFITNNWTSGGATNNWAIASASPYAGIYNAEAENTDGESVLETNVSTSSYVNITFSFYANTAGLDGGEYVAAAWYNGTDWINVLTVEDIADYTLYEFNLTSDADNNADFKIRFNCSSNSNNEICQIDNVYVAGTLVDLIDPTINISVNNTDVEYDVESVRIDFNASDEISLDSVIANVTYPNGTLLQQLTDQNIDFIFVPANLTALGRYNITVFANDTSDNTNTSESFFYVNDTVAPTIDISVNATDVEYGIESVKLDFNASNGFLDSVIANVTYPNGTLLQQLTDQNVDFVFEPANLTSIGRYNITVFANDTSGNTNTSESFFYVNDTVAPIINISVNDSDVEYSIESVLIDFNASNGLLDSVIANITYPNGTLLQQLTDQSIDFVFAPANLTSIGRYNITVFANDTSGNTNTSTSFFNVNDTLVPTIDIYVNDTYVQNGTESVLIDFNASDINLDSVIANVTYPNGTLLQQLTNQAIDFEFGPDNLSELGQYNITVFANDTLGNTNTSTASFSVVTGPLIDIYVNDTSVEFGIESVLIDFNASDNSTLDTIIANVTYPNGTLLQELTNQSVDFIFEPANLTVLGTYDITVFANDTDGNPNTETSFFDVDDTTPPAWDQTPQNQVTEYNTIFSYDVNASDNYLKDQYFINDTNNFDINSASGLITNATSFAPGILYLNISVNDTSNNINSTIIQITVQDSIDPVLNITYPVNGSTYYSLNFTLNWTFTEDYPDKCWYNLNNNATNTSIVDCNNLYVNFTAISLAWNNITMWINDTSNNVVTESITFYARTQTAPNVTNVTITPVYSGANVSTLNDMHCNYTYDDAEGDPDQSTIKWFRNSVLTSFTSATIPYQNTSIGEQWICEVKPYDGIDYSAVINSSAVEINVEPASLVVSDNATIYAGPAPNNNYIIWAYYTDEENNPIYDASCLITGSPASALPDSPVADGNYSKNFNWTTLNTKTHIFNCSKQNYQTIDNLSRTVTVINHPTNLIGEENTSTIELGDSVLVTANYTDADTNISLSGADCDVDIPGMGTYNMTETNVSTYEVAILFNKTGEYSPQIICSKEYYTGGNVFINTINTSDTTPPTITLIDTVNGTYNQNITFSFNVSDLSNNISDCLLYLNSTFNLTNQSEVINHEINYINLTDRQDETFLWHIECTDLNNNTGSSETRTISIDNIDPIVSLVSPPNATNTSSNSVDFTCNATDNMVDIVNITLYHNIGGSFAPNETESVSGLSNSSTFSLTSIPDGTYLWNCLAYDLADDNLSNSAFASNNYSITIDASKPDINISVNDTDVEYGIESVKIDFNASDTNLDEVIANVTYPNGALLQQLTNQATDFIFNSSNLSALGQYNITVFANDTFGNSNTSESFFNVGDTTSPTWNQTPSSQVIEYNTPFSYQVNASDNYQIDKYFIDDTSSFAINPSTGIITNHTVLDLGIYSLNISVNDTSNNINSELISITVNDPINPTWDQLPENQTIEYNIPFSYDINASDNYQVDKYFTNDTNNFAINADGIITNNTLLDLGIYSLNISVNDTSNNINSSVISITIEDTTNPAWDQIPSNQNIEYNTLFSYYINASDDLLDKYFIDDNINFTINSASGLITNNTKLNLITYTLNLSVNDTSNNINSSLINITVEDTTAPTIDISINDTVLLFENESVTIDFNASDYFLDSVIANVKYPNGTLLQQLTNQSEDFTFSPDNLTVIGTYAVTIFANDSNGNSNTASTSFDVSEEVAAVGGANIPYITYKIIPAEREPIYIPVKKWPPVEKEIPPEEIEEEEPVKVVVEEEAEEVMIGVPGVPPVEKPSLLVPLGFTLFEALLLFVSLGWFIWRNKKKYYNK